MDSITIPLSRTLPDAAFFKISHRAHKQINDFSDTLPVAPLGSNDKAPMVELEISS
jgi:hypothetical protein